MRQVAVLPPRTKPLTEVPAPVASWAQQRFSAHWSQRNRVSLEQAAPTAWAAVPSPLYGNQLPHLRLQQGTLFLAFSAGRGRTCSSVGSSIMRHSESPGDTQGCGKDKGTFPAPWVGTFQVLSPSNRPPRHPLHTPLHCSPSPSSWGKAKTASNPRRQTDAGASTLRGWRPENQSKVPHRLSYPGSPLIGTNSPVATGGPGGIPKGTSGGRRQTQESN